MWQGLPKVSAHCSGTSQFVQKPQLPGPSNDKTSPWEVFPFWVWCHVNIGHVTPKTTALEPRRLRGQEPGHKAALQVGSQPVLLPSTPSPARLSVCLTVDIHPRGQKFTGLPRRAYALRTEVRQCGGLSLAHPCVRHKRAQVHTHGHLQCTLVSTGTHTHLRTHVCAHTSLHVSIMEHSTDLHGLHPRTTNTSPQLSNYGLPQF